MSCPIPSSPAGKIRSVLETTQIRQALVLGANQNGQQPTEEKFGLPMPLAAVWWFSHQFLWITCPPMVKPVESLVTASTVEQLIQTWRSHLAMKSKKVIAPVAGNQILSGALTHLRLND